MRCIDCERVIRSHELHNGMASLPKSGSMGWIATSPANLMGPIWPMPVMERIGSLSAQHFSERIHQTFESIVPVFFFYKKFC